MRTGVIPQHPDLADGTKDGRSKPFCVRRDSHIASSLSVLGRPGQMPDVT